MEYLRARGRVLDGPLPVRVVRPAPALRPDAKVFEEFAAGSGKQAVSTTMVFARLLRNLVRDPTVGSLVAPIVSDEARTFGLEPLIAEAKIYAPEGQHYIPVDADLPLNYAESASGQLLQEGISEAGALSTFIALSTAYATWGQPMVPVFLFYSMFGFQRVGDLAWALGDMRGRGILAGCTAGRTTLMGEGLQHDDGQSPLLASTNPAALVYDASFAYEVAVIMEAAVTDMLGATPQDRFWYLTLYNETYPMPALPEGAAGEAVRRGIMQGIYPFAPAPDVKGKGAPRASLCFSGPMWNVAKDAQRILAERYGVAADTWAVTSWTNLRTDALEVERWNRLHPESEPRTAVITDALGGGSDPVVAITDYMRGVPDQVARFVDRPYLSLGTDGFGRSDARDALRSYFEVDSANLVVAVLQQLARGGKIKPSVVAEAIAAFGIDADGRAPFIVS
jgi:pyruvate dehydrogenase E1 component